jgi:hypothetical protein
MLKGVGTIRLIADGEFEIRNNSLKEVRQAISH